MQLGHYVVVFINILRITQSDTTEAQKKCEKMDAATIEARSKAEVVKDKIWSNHQINLL